VAVETVRLRAEDAVIDIRKNWRKYAAKDGVFVPPDVRPIAMSAYVDDSDRKAVVRVYLPHGYIVVLEYSEVLSKLYAWIEYAIDCNCDCGVY